MLQETVNMIFYLSYRDQLFVWMCQRLFHQFVLQRTDFSLWIWASWYIHPSLFLQSCPRRLVGTLLNFRVVICYRLFSQTLREIPLEAFWSNWKQRVWGKLQMLQLMDSYSFQVILEAFESQTQRDPYWEQATRLCWHL